MILASLKDPSKRERVAIILTWESTEQDFIFFFWINREQVTTKYQ